MRKPKSLNYCRASDGNIKRRFLQQQQIQMVEDALSSLGEYGEVRLVVEKGQLRFLVTQKSIDMLKVEPGVSVKDLEYKP
jgi:hypothetical protein